MIEIRIILETAFIEIPSNSLWTKGMIITSPECLGNLCSSFAKALFSTMVIMKKLAIQNPPNTKKNNVLDSCNWINIHTVRDPGGNCWEEQNYSISQPMSRRGYGHPFIWWKQGSPENWSQRLLQKLLIIYLQSCQTWELHNQCNLPLKMLEIALLNKIS
ncbi:unnamed protein product [Moneuplotes crassus]|uniref:Uncharacterized protein n=1 Tax=Euplotes crassus TaxID=5936 RepID=A0AAD1U9N0_EUPCR|nr:unnamed protein product [Moneuplotes crassus]